MSAGGAQIMLDVGSVGWFDVIGQDAEFVSLRKFVVSGV